MGRYFFLSQRDKKILKNIFNIWIKIWQKFLLTPKPQALIDTIKISIKLKKFKVTPSDQEANHIFVISARFWKSKVGSIWSESRLFRKGLLFAGGQDGGQKRKMGDFY